MESDEGKYHIVGTIYNVVPMYQDIIIWKDNSWYSDVKTSHDSYPTKETIYDF